MATQEEKNRQMVTNLGGLVEALFDEVSVLPLSDSAKATLVTIMLGDIMTRDGQTISFKLPPNLAQTLNV